MADGQKITLGGSMPAEGMNGLAPYAKDFLEKPLEARLFVGVIVNRRTVRDHITGNEYPVLAIQHWELVPENPIDQKSAAKILGKALSLRTGKVELPFSPGEEIPMKDQFPDDPNFPDGPGQEGQTEEEAGGGIRAVG